MALRPALLLAFTLAAWPLPASAQVGDVPGAPGAAPPGTAPACQQLRAVRDETQKHAIAIRDAGQRKAGPREACRLFKVFLASETKMIEGVEQNGAACGVPPEVIAQLKTQHARAARTGKQICDVAQGPPAPSLNDGPGTPPIVPVWYCFETLRPSLSCKWTNEQ
ncbi:MAG TPA: hypothetical protein VFB88_00075 [Xanthobacteraceae bacterium]|nr:hypothetical protein [Xanthobacteraceae bacterium]